MNGYEARELAAIYELGRLYYEMGYLAAAERVFNGLMTIDDGMTPSCIGAGLVRLERGEYPQAMELFRQATKGGRFVAYGKIGLALSLVAQGDTARAEQLMRELREAVVDEPGLKALWEALLERCTT